MSERKALAAALLVGLATGLPGLRWGLPGPWRWRVFPEGWAMGDENARRFTDSWTRLYEGIRRAHREMSAEEPPTYARGLTVVEPGWSFPPDPLVNSSRSFLLQSENPDEKKSFVILSQMRPWKLQFEPLYVQYGGAFIYPLGAFLKAASLVGAARLVPDMGHYLRRPEDMGRLYLLGRVFILLFQLGGIALAFLLARELAGEDDGAAAGLAAAALLALAPVSIVNAHLIKPHAYSAFWVSAAALFMLRALRDGRTAAFLACGCCAGAAAGSNLSLAPLLLLPVCAIARGKGSVARAIAGCAAAAAVVAAANPYLLFSYKDFAWETQVYSPQRLSIGSLTALAHTAAHGLGKGCLALVAAGLLLSLSRGGPARRLAAAAVLAGAVLWARFGGFSSDPGALRLFLPLLGVACALAASALWSAPMGLRWICLAAALIDGSARASVYLLNMSRDSQGGGTRTAAADWIEREAPEGASLGLSRFPEPAHTPPFRWNRYRLVIFERPEDLERAGLPDYLVVDAPGRAAIDNWAKNNYDAVAEFSPDAAGWARLSEESSFINEAMFVYRRREPRGS